MRLLDAEPCVVRPGRDLQSSAQMKCRRIRREKGDRDSEETEASLLWCDEKKTEFSRNEDVRVRPRQQSPSDVEQRPNQHQKLEGRRKSLKVYRAEWHNIRLYQVVRTGSAGAFAV